jgi:hypothetical protein
MKRVTIFLPNELHEQLREEALRRRVSLAKLIRARLGADVEQRRRAARKRDPLATAVGIIRNGTLTRRLDEELYGL